MIKKIHACNRINFSSNIVEVIRTVLNFLFFFILFFFNDKISQPQKSTKKHKKAQKALKHN